MIIFYPAQRFCNDRTDLFRRMRFCGDVLNNCKVNYSNFKNVKDLKLYLKHIHLTQIDL